jgi:hypothetical protein
MRVLEKSGLWRRFPGTSAYKSSLLTLCIDRGFGKNASMPRKLRIQYPGAMYHVMNRGDRRENIFWDKPDREVFISSLSEACRQTEWQVHA